MILVIKIAFESQKFGTFSGPGIMSIHKIQYFPGIIFNFDPSFSLNLLEETKCLYFLNF